ncbi:hypothetical protein VQ03_10780 [Methylobacterium tarhaniae]|uniref:EfeO-type cupredoxin-like domain-containing protein n=1 Tax=Methylobacterium tarhaniae TaxID=1187852 RepID=A0A0J6TAC3_9HYPH|nr:hypothetical protein [Methylobacterium tarhaniae]KMO42523.1 hypothetical protein VQ03_10780 [Methylobacterium tarhaniae]
MTISLRAATAAAFLAVALSGGARAANDLPPPKTDAMPPVEVTITAENGVLACAPAELRLPAQSNVDLHVTNQSNLQVSLTAPQIFQNKNVLHHDGDVVHVASNDAYMVKANGKGEIRLRTIAPGEYTYGCTATTKQDKPFTGKLTLVDPAK